MQEKQPEPPSRIVQIKLIPVLGIGWNLFSSSSGFNSSFVLQDYRKDGPESGHLPLRQRADPEKLHGQVQVEGKVMFQNSVSPVL